MKDTRFIFVEGIMGSGKSTTAWFLTEQLQQNGIAARFLAEGPTFEEPEHPLRVATMFPQLGSLFVSTVPQRGLAFVTNLLQEARAREIITDIDLEAVARMMLGGLLTYAITNLAFAGEEVPPPAFDRADAIVEVIMRALEP